MDIEKLLDMLGNETRREILQMLSERPYYVSELSQELSVGQKAIIEHLSLMHGAGIVKSKFEKVKKGRPRKYFLISKDLMLEVSIGADTFNARTSPITIDHEVLDSLPNLKKITERLEKLSGEDTKELREIYNELEREKRNISQAKNVIECIQGRIRSELKREVIERELDRLLA